MNQNLQNILELQTALTQLHEADQRLHGIPDWMRELHEEHLGAQPPRHAGVELGRLGEIGRASCRERVWTVV